LSKFNKVISRFSTGYIKEGYRTEGGNAKLLIMTRKTSEARIEEAFLHFERDDETEIECKTKLGTVIRIERNCITQSLRTSVGIRNLDITEHCDYIAKIPYKKLSRVKTASGIRGKFEPDFWDTHQRTIEKLKSHLLLVRRINPYSPNTHLMAFFSSEPICPGDQLKAVPKFNLDQSRAMTVMFNSILFLAQFILLKEESTGRVIDVRSYDVGEADIYPDDSFIPTLIKIFDKYSQMEFPSLREQLDTHFDQRYKDFWSMERHGKPSLFSVLNNTVEPADIRLKFDLDVCKALGIDVTPYELTAVYEAIVKEMILTRGLTRD
jgi:hypothetical protein